MAEDAKKVILNVDDNEAGRYAVSKILARAKFHVVEASNGKDALRLARELPDLILLDVNLPDFDGFEVCRRIKSSPETSGIPILHLSATNVGSDSKVTGLDGGADGYLVQPVEPEVLLATIRALLRMKQAEEEARRKTRELEEALSKIRVLSGLVPICSWCKKIRDDQGYWHQIETYISEHSEAEFSHGMCEECAKKVNVEFDEEMRAMVKPKEPGKP